MSSTTLPKNLIPFIPAGADAPGKTDTLTKPGKGQMVDGRYTNNYEGVRSYNQTWNGSFGVGGDTSDLFTPKKRSGLVENLLSRLPTWGKSGSFDKSAIAYQRQGSFNALGGLASGQGSVAIGEAYARGNGSVEFKNGAFTAQGDVSAAATLIDAQGSVHLGKGDYTLDASGSAFVGAKAHAHGELTFDPAHGVVAAKVGGEAFVGARVGVEGNAKLGQFGSVGGSAEAWAGVGAAFHAEAGIKDGHFKARVDFGAALGIGFKLGFNVDINFKGIADTVKKVVAAPVEAIKNVGHAIGEGVKKVGNFFKHLF